MSAGTRRKARSAKAAAGEVTVTNRQRLVRVPVGRVRELVEFVAAAEGRRIGQLDVAVVDAGEMASLNRRHLGRRGATDVLSFDLSGPGRELSAQIVVCGDVAARQAAQRGHSRLRELMLYVVHGLLHATGHDDRRCAQAKAMHAREDELLERFGVGPVYRRPRKSPQAGR